MTTTIIPIDSREFTKNALVDAWAKASASVSPKTFRLGAAAFTELMKWDPNVFVEFGVMGKDILHLKGMPTAIQKDLSVPVNQMWCDSE